MKILKNKRLYITETKASSANATPKAVHTGCVQLIRFITNVPVPKQASYTGEIKLG